MEDGCLDVGDGRCVFGDDGGYFEGHGLEVRIGDRLKLNKVAFFVYTSRKGKRVLL